MAYIGRDISNLSDRAVLDNITTSATATYNLLLNSVAFVPSSAESLTVSLNGVIQKPQSSYTVSGSTIVFDSALTSSDSIDFILAERAITLTTIGSGTVTTSNLVDGSVTASKINSTTAFDFPVSAFFGEETLTDGSTIAWNLQTQQVAKVTLGGNRTLNAPTNQQAGAFYALAIIQDGTGSRTLTFNSAYKFTGATAPTLTTTASAKDIIIFKSDGTNLLEVGRSLNIG
ncbi:hypothetical protein [uncultured Mediterranean phage uvMED]|nr:hypothetical protein [uncultured Mediterranean phage uvMED]